MWTKYIKTLTTILKIPGTEKWGVVMYIYDLRIGEAETGIQGQSNYIPRFRPAGIHSEALSQNKTEPKIWNISS